MVKDQFGLIGVLTFIRAAKSDPSLVSLSMGANLQLQGMNMNSETHLFPLFGGPWATIQCRSQDVDFHVPYEYLTNSALR